MAALDKTPDFRSDQALKIAREHFGVTAVTARSLPSERDQNFLLSTKTERWVLKISNGHESLDTISGQNQMLAHVGRQIQLCPKTKNTSSGDSSVVVQASSGSRHIVRLVSFVEGCTLSNCSYRSNDLFNSIGEKIADLSEALSDFEHPSFHRSFQWDLASGVDVVTARMGLLSPPQRALARHCLDDYRRFVSPIVDGLPKSVIHNDANDGNVIVAVTNVGLGHKVTGLIDFGDAVYSFTVAELAIAIAYAILQTDDRLLAACTIVSGYSNKRSLTDEELTALFGMIRLRMCLSMVMAAEQQTQRPDDEYLSISQTPIQETLPQLCDVPYLVATSMFRHAANKDAVPQAAMVTAWINENCGSFAFPIPRAADQKFKTIDLSAASPLLTGPPESWTTQNVDQAILQNLGDDTDRDMSTISVGRYLEPRLLYAGDQFVQSDSHSEAFAHERRTIHLGIDLFAEAATPVFAMMEGVVERVDICDEPFDYGTLVILRHTPSKEVTFYSLYGHLASTCRNLQRGQLVQQGEQIGQLGAPDDNGGWSPHLHFQLATDLLQTDTNFPGVCLRSQQKVWSAICPDPSAMLNIASARYNVENLGVEATQKRRQKNLGYNLSVGYQKPLQIVRGQKHFLFDESGHRFLDAYNNVPHVGHCHPKVVEALRSQASLLNTNTRYLHELRNEFAEALTATMPDHLSVCYFVSSASEANELALRMARVFTQQNDVVVLEGAYHGHSTSLIEMSPYKHNGPGGKGPADWVHTAPVADVYRGQYRDPVTAGSNYADCVEEVIKQAEGRGRRMAAFIAESCPSVGGQIIFPDGYLSSVYQHVRKTGAVCIADEVQTGYGRLGKYFYGFEQQRVVPDLVVLGKPIGNGHPLAAVVTSPAIAEAFNNGMEFFSTFGGNSVSCAVGLAVLQTLREDELQQNANDVGKQLLNGLSVLKTRYPLIGDVRGMGLFLGVELVRDPETLAPAAAEASFIANRMRDRGILLGTDGPHHNVLKIRPPMTFDRTAAVELVNALNRSFSEISAIL